MQSHYRGVLDFSNEALLASEKGFKKLMEAFSKLKKISFDEGKEDENIINKINSICSSCYKNILSLSLQICILTSYHKLPAFQPEHC